MDLKNKKLRKIFIAKICFLFFVFFTYFSNHLYAQGMQYRMVSYTSNPQDRASTPLFDIGIFNQEKFTINYTNNTRGIQFIFDLIIGISIATAVIVFMVAAFQKITGGGNVKSIKEGNDGMINAIVGLMIVLSTWLIVNTINPDLIRLPMFNGIDNIKPTSGPETQQSVDISS